WASFTSMLEYKAARYGRTFGRVDRFFPSTRMCSQCGRINDKMCGGRSGGGRACADVPGSAFGRRPRTDHRADPEVVQPRPGASVHLGRGRRGGAARSAVSVRRRTGPGPGNHRPRRPDAAPGSGPAGARRAPAGRCP
ncbi:zinc ribbon domain-containing protein, partial [Micromonospora sp. B11E3]|uniref:zinc ribbon domain-containing protein n=1 Tax=Micromonospora sp. B11E3 TaxID=3153562 RepID=UPI00325D6460